MQIATMRQTASGALLNAALVRLSTYYSQVKHLIAYTEITATITLYRN